MTPIFQALGLGYDASQIISFLGKAFPQVGSQLKKAAKAGYSANQILDFLGKTMESTPYNAGDTESSIRGRQRKRREELERSLMKTVATGAAAYGAGRAIPAVAQGIRGMFGGGGQPNAPGPAPINAMPSPQPPIGPQPMAGAPVQPPPVPPVGPTPGNIVPPNAPAAPPQAIPNPSGNLTPDRSVAILKEMGLEQRIRNLTDAGNSPDVIAAALNAGLTPGQRKWFGEKLKAGETKPLQDLVKDYLSTQPTGKESSQVQNAQKEIPSPEVRPMLEPSSQKLDEATKATQGTPEITPEYGGESLDERAKYLRRIDEEDTHLGKQEKERLDHIEYWEKWLKEHTKNRENPLKSTKDFIREAKAQQKVMGTHYARGHDKDTQREMHDSLQRYIDHLSELDAHEEADKLARKNLKKGDLVFDEQSGISGNIKDIKNKEALIEDNGKVHKVKVEDLERTPEDIIKAAQDLLKIPEVDKSSVISLATYRPRYKQLFIQYHNGETYVYEDVPEERAVEIQHALGVATTTGKNSYGAWNQDVQSRGAALIHKILKDPKYGKDQEGKTWEKIGTFYDFWKGLRKQPKRKKK